MKNNTLFSVYQLLLSLFCLFFISTSYSVNNLAFNLKGVIKTNSAAEKINITLLDTDNSILDVSNINPDGSYTIDLGTMDESTFEEVKKLSLKLERGNQSKFVRIVDYMKEMSKTILLRPIRFP